MKIKTVISILIIALAVPGFLQAQQRPIHSLYMFDPLLINPAYAGNHVQLSGTAIYRNQWVNFPGSPKTFTASVHSGFRKARVGVGLLFGKDVIGIHNEDNVYLQYSYKIPVSRTGDGVLSFGLQGGFNNLKSDFTLLDPKDRTDNWASVVDRNWSWNFGAGMYYRSNKVYAGLSVPYIMNNKVIDLQNINSLAKQARYYYLTAGYTHEVSPILKLLPSTLIRVQETAPISFDFNLIAVLYNTVGFGLSWRLDDSTVGLFELQLNENFHVGYAYDFTTTSMKYYSNGSHEVMVNYRVKIPKLHKGLPCPSYY